MTWIIDNTSVTTVVLYFLAHTLRLFPGTVSAAPSESLASFSVPASASGGHRILDVNDYISKLKKPLQYSVTMIIHSNNVFNMKKESEYRCGENICTNHFRCYFCLTPTGIYQATDNFKGSSGESYLVHFKTSSKNNRVSEFFAMTINVVSPCAFMNSQHANFTKVCAPNLSKLTPLKTSGFVTTLKYTMVNELERLFQVGLLQNKLKGKPSNVRFSILGTTNSSSSKRYVVQEQRISLTDKNTIVRLNIISRDFYKNLEITMRGEFNNIELKAEGVELFAYNAKELCHKSSCITQYRSLKLLLESQKCTVPLMKEYNECLGAPTIQFLSNIRAELGHSVGAYCRVSSLQRFKVSWYFIDGTYQREITESTKNLKAEGIFLGFEPITLEHTGRYRCVAETSSTKVFSNVFSLQVLNSFTYDLRVRMRGRNFSSSLNTRSTAQFKSEEAFVASAVANEVTEKTMRRAYYRVRNFTDGNGSVIAKGVFIVERLNERDSLLKAYDQISAVLAAAARSSSMDSLSTISGDARLTHIDICPSEINIPIPGLTLVWPATLQSGTAQIPCPVDGSVPLTRVCSKNKDNIAVWGSYDAAPCTTKATAKSSTQIFSSSSTASSSIQASSSVKVSTTTYVSTSTMAQTSTQYTTEHLTTIYSQPRSTSMSTSSGRTVQSTSSSRMVKSTSSLKIVKSSSSLLVSSAATSSITVQPTLTARQTRKDAELSKLLEKYDKDNLTDAEAQNVSESLSSITKPSNKETVSSTGISDAAKILKKLSNNIETSQQVRDQCMDVIDNLLLVDASEMKRSQQEFNSSSRLLEILGDYGGRLAGNKTYTVSRSKFALGALAKESKTFSGYQTFLTVRDGKAALDVRNSTPSNPTSRTSISIPPSLITDARITSDKVKIVFTAFVDPLLFPSDAILSPGDDSSIIAVEIRGHTIEGLTRPVEIKIDSKKDVDDAFCGFWDPTKGSGEWSTRGCYKAQTEGGLVTCHCNHMTNFALLFGAKTSASKAHTTALMVLTYVGSGVSLCGAGITFITYLIHPKLRDSNPPKILMNLLAALIVLYVVFLAAIDRTDSEKGCRVAAIALQYAFLAVFSWSFVEGVTSFRGIVQPMAQEIRKLLPKSMVIGWGVPLVLTAIGASVWPEKYGSDFSCVVRDLPLYVTVLGPVGITLLLNYAALAGIMCSLNQSSKRYSHNSMTNRDRLRIIVAFILLFGLTWVFGLLVISNDILAFQYIFCILSSLHGFFVFLFYCVRNENVRRAWAETLHLKRSRHYTASTSETKKSDLHSESAT